MRIKGRLSGYQFNHGSDGDPEDADALTGDLNQSGRNTVGKDRHNNELRRHLSSSAACSPPTEESCSSPRCAHPSSAPPVRLPPIIAKAPPL
ncbi:hypothetical protein Pmani_031961 [Petrolisthes manimaculis]|uniref:Uncharacterized protein n=1 Tax=Petrolisthes manimaculis TaxID=1843537 RepID=A0AAE1TRG6_9EUCA|nr:hypothetical protein Pmani_031961 [Petrolisthes manimaculis]